MNLRGPTRRPRLIAGLVALAVAAAFAPARATIVTLGDVTPNPVTPVVAGAVRIGNSTVGSVLVGAGSTVTADSLVLGSGVTGDGTLSVTGTGSFVNLLRTVPTNLEIGQRGLGRLTVSDGGGFLYGDAGTPCLSGCLAFVSNGAGSTGVVDISGIGSSFATVGRVFVGHASVFTVAADGFDFGTPGGASSGRFDVSAGAVVGSAQLTIASPGGGTGHVGTETSTGVVTLDGSGTRWTVSRPVTTVGDTSLVAVATGARTDGRLDITGGARLSLDGSADPTVFSGINIGAGGPTSRGEVRVIGAGSVIDLTGGQGFINVGRPFTGTGGSGRLEVSDGGRITGIGDSGLQSVSIGRLGATGDLVVQGHDAAGTPSQLNINGYNTVTGGGSFYGTGRAGSTGTTSVLAGGRIDLDSSAFTLANPASISAVFIGDGVGGSGDMTISGRNAVTGVGSTVAVTGGPGLNPYGVVGRDGGTGTMTIADGGRFIMQGNLATTGPATGSGERLFLEIGDRFGAGTAVSTGTVTVTGSGSLLALTGAADRLINIGNGGNASGTLNVADGGRVESLQMLVGNGATNTGTVNVASATVALSGTFVGGPAPGNGASLVVGFRGGTGTANITAGSRVEISSVTGNLPGVFIGGTSFDTSGTGIVNVSGGSQLIADGNQARVSVGNAGTAGAPGVGTLNVTGAGSVVQAIGAASTILAGFRANTIGTIDVGAGAQIVSSDLIGIAHDGTASTPGTGTLCVDGTATAARIMNGANGTICGSGRLEGDVTNLGILSPGRSPGRITISRYFDTSGGTIILDVRRRGGGLLDIAGGTIHFAGIGDFDVDEIVLEDFSLATFGDVNIVFNFLDATNPEEFDASGLWTLGTFFLEGDGAGGVKPIDDADLDAFGGAVFSAQAERYVFTHFSFTRAARRSRFRRVVHRAARDAAARGAGPAGLGVAPPTLIHHHPPLVATAASAG